MTTDAITVVNASYRAGSRHLLRDVNVRIAGSAITVIAGPNGAGKSTLLGLLTGSLRPASGEVHLRGKSLNAYRPADLAQIRGVMPQDLHVDVPMRVSQIVALGRFPHRKTSTKKHDEALIAAALAETETTGLTHRYYHTLSGGERARVALARLLVQEAAVMVLDEPIASLDPKHQYLVLDILRKRADAGAAVIVVLHDLHLSRTYADDAVLLRNGTVAAVGSASSVLSEDALERVFDIPFLRGELTNGSEVIVPTNRVG